MTGQPRLSKKNIMRETGPAVLTDEDKVGHDWGREDADLIDDIVTLRTVP